MGNGTQSSFENPLQQVSDTETMGLDFSRLRQMLGHTKEDEMLSRKLGGLETSVSQGFNKKNSLASKNLQKVYGKVVGKFNNLAFKDPRN